MYIIYYIRTTYMHLCLDAGGCPPHCTLFASIRVCANICSPPCNSQSLQCVFVSRRRTCTSIRTCLCCVSIYRVQSCLLLQFRVYSCNSVSIFAIPCLLLLFRAIYRCAWACLFVSILCLAPRVSCLFVSIRVYLILAPRVSCLSVSIRVYFGCVSIFVGGPCLLLCIRVYYRVYFNRFVSNSCLFWQRVYFSACLFSPRSLFATSPGPKNRHELK